MRGFSRCPGALAASDIRRVSKVPARRRTFEATSTSGSTALTTMRFSSAKASPFGASVRSPSTHQLPSGARTRSAE